MKKTQKLILIVLSLMLFNCSDDEPNTINSQMKRLDEIIKTDGTSKAILKYNDDNVNIGAEYFEINSDGVTWNKIEDISLSYNSNNLVSVEIATSWNGTELINNSKVEYTYNIDSNIDTKIYSYWNETSNNWELSTDGTEQYNYNSGALIETLTNGRKTSYIYNGNLLIKKERFGWNYDNNNWHDTPTSKTEYLYNIENDIIAIKEYHAFNGDALEEYEKTEYQYDNNYTRSDLILPFNFDDFNILPFKTNHMVIKSESFDSSDIGWVSYWKDDYFYTDIDN